MAQSTPSPFTVQQLPTELWFAICDWIAAPRDLSALARTCKYMAEVSGPAFYSHISWSEKNYHTSMDALSTRPEVFRNVRALALKDFVFSPSWAPFTDMDPQFITDVIRQPPYELFNKLSPALRNLVQLIPRFPHLQVLNFRRVQLPPTLYSELANLPALTSLSLRHCNLMMIAPRDNSDLHLRTLRLDNMRWIHNNDASRDAMCSLACTAELEHLEVDAHIAPMVFGLMMSTATAADRPLMVRSLRTEARSDEAGDFVSIASFLANAPSIEVLHLGRVPKSVAISSTALPNLRVLSGPAHCIEAFVERRPVQHVRILDQQPATRQHHNALISLLNTPHQNHGGTDPQATATSGSEVVQIMEKVARTAPPLRRLDFRITVWDIEVLYALAALFPNLSEIRINCIYAGPHEDFMVEFASQFITSFPRLEALHIYGDNTRSRHKPELLSETRGHIGLWARHNRHLREVAMASDVVWRKYGERDWSMTEPSHAGFRYR